MDKGIIYLIIFILCIVSANAVYTTTYNPYTQRLQFLQSPNQSGNNWTADYFFGQPIEGGISNGIVWAAEIDGFGQLNLTHAAGTRDITYPDMTVRVVSTPDGNEKYCNILSDTVTVTDDSHVAYVVLASDCSIVEVPVSTFIAADISQVGNTPIFHTMSHSGVTEVHQGLPILNRLYIRSRLLSLKTVNLDVVSGLSIIPELEFNFTITSGEYIFVDEVVSATVQNLTNGAELEVFYRDGGDYYFDEYEDGTQTGLNLTSCEDASQDIVTCSLTTRYRRYFIFVTGYVDGMDMTEIHQRLALEDMNYATLGACLNTEANPLTYDLPDFYTYTAVPLYAYCGRANDAALVDAQFIDLRTVQTGQASGGIDTSIFLTKDGTRELTGNWDAGDFNITISDSLFVEDYVGIGTTTPKQKLQVGDNSASNIYMSFQTSNANERGILYYLSDGTTVRGYVKWNNLEDLELKGDEIRFDVTDTDDAMIVDTNGNVGIGTTTPQDKLHIQDGSSGFAGTYNARTSAIIESDTSLGTVLSIMAPDTGYSGIFFGDDNSETSGQVRYLHTDNKLYFYSGGRDNAIFGWSNIVFNEDGNDVDFRVEGVGNTNALFVQGSDGNVGIAETTPDAPLEIAGTSTLIHLDSTSNAYLKIDKSAANRAGFIFFDTADSTKWNVGTPDSDLIGDGSDFAITTTPDGSSPPAFFIDRTNDNVGLGKVNPTAKLEVQGGVAISNSTDTHLRLAGRTNVIPDTSDAFIVTSMSGGSYPFTAFGNLVMGPRSNAAGFDYVVMTGNPATVRMVIEDTGNIIHSGTTNLSGDTLVEGDTTIKGDLNQSGGNVGLNGTVIIETMPSRGLELRQAGSFSANVNARGGGILSLQVGATNKLTMAGKNIEALVGLNVTGSETISENLYVTQNVTADSYKLSNRAEITFDNTDNTLDLNIDSTTVRDGVRFIINNQSLLEVGAYGLSGASSSYTTASVPSDYLVFYLEDNTRVLDLRTAVSKFYGSLNIANYIYIGNNVIIAPKNDDGVHWGVKSTDGTTNFNMIFADYDHWNRDFDHSLPSPDPTFFFQGSRDPNTDNTHWGSVTYNSDSEQFRIAVGNGTLNISAPVLIERNLDVTQNISSGIDDIIMGNINVYGDSADEGGEINIYNSVNKDDVVNLYQWKAVESTLFLYAEPSGDDILQISNTGNVYGLTSNAPTTDEQLANKKYVDDSINLQFFSYFNYTNLTTTHVAAIPHNYSTLGSYSVLNLWFEKNGTDMSGSGNDVITSIVTNTTGVVEDAYAFDGANDIIEIANDISLSPEDHNFTFIAWFKTEVSGATQTIWQDYGANANYLFFVAVNTDDKMKLYLRDVNTDDIEISGVGDTVNDGEWHQVAFVKNTSITAHLFLDGIYIASDTDASFDEALTSTGNNPSLGSFTISFANDFTGSIDEVLMFNRSLTADEIKDNYDVVIAGAVETFTYDIEVQSKVDLNMMGNEIYNVSNLDILGNITSETIAVEKIGCIGDCETGQIGFNSTDLCLCTSTNVWNYTSFDG